MLDRPAQGWVSPANHGVLSVRDEEHYIHPVMGCRSACRYCYLNASPTARLPLRLHLGVGSLWRTIGEVIADARGRNLLFSTGELADSLAAVARFHLQPLHQEISFAPLLATSDKAPIRHRPKPGEHEVVGDAPLKQQALLLAILRQQTDAVSEAAGRA